MSIFVHCRLLLHVRQGYVQPPQTQTRPPSGVSIGRLSGVGALWDCVSYLCGGGGGCAGGGVPPGAVPVLSWCGEVSLGGIQSSSHHHRSGRGCAGGGAPPGAVPVLSWCGEVSLGGIQSSSHHHRSGRECRIHKRISFRGHTDLSRANICTL